MTFPNLERARAYLERIGAQEIRRQPVRGSGWEVCLLHCQWPAENNGTPQDCSLILCVGNDGGFADYLGTNTTGLTASGIALKRMAGALAGMPQERARVLDALLAADAALRMPGDQAKKRIALNKIDAARALFLAAEKVEG